MPEPAQLTNLIEPSALDDSNIQAMANILTSGVEAEATENFRKQRIEHYRQRAAALQEEEKKLKASMNPEVLSIVRSKHITLLRRCSKTRGGKTRP